MKRLLFCAVAAAVAACAAPERTGEGPRASAADLEKVTAVLKRDFRAKGQATMDRVELDEVQRLCNIHRDRPPPEVAKRIEEAQMRTIRYPAGNLMGDWKRGEKIAQSGRGSMWNDKPGAAAGGGCYNCHELAPTETSFGTLGPSLRGFGKLRGNGPDMQRYVYGKVFNSKAYNACSHMPRLGHAGTLTEEQIKDVVALLLAPDSPVNR